MPPRRRQRLLYRREYLFKVLAKVQTVHVPYPGGAPAITAVLGNHVGALAATVSPLIVHINAGKLRGLGIASAKRYPVVPDVPTYAENGFADFTAASWVGFFVPSKTASATIEQAQRRDQRGARGYRRARAPARGSASQPMQGNTSRDRALLQHCPLTLNPLLKAFTPSSTAMERGSAPCADQAGN